MRWYVNVIEVDPRDAERVWVGGVNWFRSDDGGRNWGLASYGGTGVSSYAHVDQHGLAFHPRYDGAGNQIVLIGNDGGVFRTANARARVATGPRAACDRAAIEIAWESLNRGLAITQFYFGLPYADGSRYLGGTQDNGTVLGDDQSGPDGWRTIYGGDGGHVAVPPNTTQTIYAEFQWATLAKSVDGGARFTPAVAGLDAVRSDVLGPEANYLFVTPFTMDPVDPQRLWLGGEFLYRTVNGAQQWTKIGNAMPDGSLVSAMAIASQNVQQILVGTNKGHVLWTRRGLEASSSIPWDSQGPREGWVTSVAIDPRDDRTMYATYGNFGGAHVFRTSDDGATWQSLDGSGESGLPDIPVHNLVVDPSDSARLHLGTDLGVFVSIDGGERWMVEETGFGPAVTEWLALYRDPSGRRQLFAFTHGRGVWRVELR